MTFIASDSAGSYSVAKVEGFAKCDWAGNRTKIYQEFVSLCRSHDYEFVSGISVDSLDQITKQHIVYVLMGDLINPFDEWQRIDQRCQELNKQISVITDNPLDLSGTGSLDRVKFLFDQPLLGAMWLQGKVPEFQTPERLYNCFMQRIESVRQSWFYLLYSNQLLDKGFVSFLLNQLTSYSKLKGKELFDWIHTEYNLNKVPDFELAYQNLKFQVPYKNFHDDGDLISLMTKSKYSLVLDTYAMDDDVQQWCFTEKTFVALQIPTIPLLFVQKNGYKKLEELGLKIPFDYSGFDQLGWQARQQALIDIIKNDRLEVDPNLLQQSAEYNSAVIKTWYDQYHTNGYIENLFNKNR